MIEPKIISSIDVEINARRLERRVMLSKNRAPPWLMQEINDCLSQCRPQPRAIYSFFDCEVYPEKNKIIIDNYEFKSEFMAKRFKYAKEIGLLVLTTGDQIEEKGKQAYADKNSVNALIYDSIGSEYAESTADALQKIIEKEKNYCMSRYSPGYNDWHISDQQKIFTILPAEKINIDLNESFLMHPEKSISAMIGYSDKNNKECGKCSLNKNCAYRGVT